MNKQIKVEYKHLIDEIQLPNICNSLSEGNFNKIKNLHYAIHEFANTSKLIIKTESDFQSKSAFLMYLHESYERAHQSLIASLSGHYNSAYNLLRNLLELIIKGAFWECIAHKTYRQQLKNNTRKKDTLKKSIDDLIMEKPEFENQLEKRSASIYDLTEEFIKNKGVHVPRFKEMIEQLEKWNILYPSNNQATKILYDKLYNVLSKNVHVQPDFTDIGRRILSNDDEMFKTTIITEELDNYLDVLSKLIDLSIVIELNILDSLISNHSETNKIIQERLNCFKSLNFIFTVNKLESLISKDET